MNIRRETRHRLALHLAKRRSHINGPFATFTFDDFPRSALHVGGALLAEVNARGTYYAAPSLMGTSNDAGDHFEIDDLYQLIGDGHELGSHTHSHVSGAHLPVVEYIREAAAGRSALKALLDRSSDSSVEQFSYPFGYVTASLKRGVAPLFTSCRGTIAGLNTSPIDLNLLRANKIYHRSFDLDTIRNLVDAAARNRAWLIFYTHDVEESPSPFGCTTQELAAAIRLVHQHRIPIVTVGQALAYIHDVPRSPDAILMIDHPHNLDRPDDCPPSTI